MAGRLHLGSRHTAVEREPDNTGEVYGPGPGGSSVAEDASPGPYAATTAAPMVEDRALVVARRRAANSGGLSAGLTLIGLLTIVIGAWGGIVAYIGPTFGYDANGSGSWVWNWQHSLLYLIPGAVAVATGLWMWALAARTHAGLGRLGSAMGGLVLLAAGAWFALGPLVWPIFYSSPVFNPASPQNNFVNQLGYNVGPGLILAALGGMTLASAAVRRRRA